MYIGLLGRRYNLLVGDDSGIVTIGNIFTYGAIE